MSPQDGAEFGHRTALAADRARIAAIEAKILELERSLYSLNEEKDILQGRLDAYTYPVLTLPNEIVSEIFVHFLPIYPEAPPIIGRSSPNVLGQICRKWRGIALRTPALWRGISLSLSNGKRFDQKLRLLKLWLQRSGSCLLSIHMDLEVDDMDPSGDADTNLAATLDLFTHAIAAHSARWEYVRLYPRSRHFPFITAPLPFLRSLTMDSVKPAANGNDSLTEALHAAPLLRTVAVAFWPVHCISVYPWSQLTTFVGHLILPHHCVDILTQALNLVHCNVFVDWVDADVSQPARNITLPYLSTLILNGLISRNIPWKFLDVFTLQRSGNLKSTALSSKETLSIFSHHWSHDLGAAYKNYTSLDVPQHLLDRIASPCPLLARS
ncbi:hypothetical protein B0H16DRAFT_380780 [Mycena metata]|uniref:F-box domain-containing protein n=1 Tax=Mycena metata TaxID=1033252 RepID=A0AAD7MK67_9AGAR|nr:hypothetical protein B0H16DRAFT_380780 [Mycena metata]